MNTNIYTYSLLQYRHSLVLEEVLNVGILVYYHQSQQIFFLYPDKLTRLRLAYPDLAEKTIKAYCRLFQHRTEELSSTPEVFARYDMEKSFSQFINDELLPADSSSLQFSAIKKALLLESSNIEKSKNQLYNRYFGFFEADNDGAERIDELTLLNRYNRLLEQIAGEDFSNRSDKIIKDYTIHPTAESEITFGFAWRSNTINLVKPVSFDLKLKKTIQRKSYENYGQFLSLEEEAEKKNYRFDLLLARPGNKELFKAYDDAVSLLQKPRHVKLVESEDLNEYTASTVKAVLFQ